MSYYTSQELAAMDRDARNMAIANVPLSAELDDIRTLLTSGNLGILADARDVDAVAQGGGMFTRDKDTGPGTSLVFAWLASRINTGLANVSVSAASLTLTPSTINYIEVDRLGTVSFNTGGFTAGRMPLWVVTTSSASYDDDEVVSAKPFLQLISLVTGAMLSQAGSTKEIAAQLGASIAATTSFYLSAPAFAAVLAGVSFVNSTAFAGSDTDYWTWTLANLGPSGTGTTVLLAGAATNTTKATGGSSLSVGVARALTLTATTGDRATAANDVLQLTLTKTGAPAPLTLSSIRLDFAFAV